MFSDLQRWRSNHWSNLWLIEDDLQYESNEYRDKTWNQTHKTTNNTIPHSDDEITNKNKKFDICENHLFILKKRKKKWYKSDSKSTKWSKIIVYHLPRSMTRVIVSRK